MVLPYMANRPGWVREGAVIEFMYQGRIYQATIESHSYSFCIFKSIIDVEKNRPAFTIPSAIPYPAVQNPIVKELPE